MSKIFSANPDVVSSVNVSVRMPIQAVPSLDNSQVPLVEILQSSKDSGVVDRTQLVMYPFRYKTVETKIPVSLYNYFYTKVPANSDSNVVAKYIGLVTAMYFNIDVQPISGRKPTMEDILALRVVR